MSTNPPPGASITSVSITSVFYPQDPQAATNLTNATLFTRTNVIADPEAVKTALEGCPHTHNTFLVGHFNDILIFDTVETVHTVHVQVVMQMLQDNNLYSDIQRCAFLQPTWAKAGFFIKPINEAGNCFMIILREHMAPDALED